MKNAEKITISCYGGCGGTVTLRKSKARKADYYLCHSKESGHLCEQKLPSIPQGKMRLVDMNAAASFWGYTDKWPNQEEAESLARAREYWRQPSRSLPSKKQNELNRRMKPIHPIITGLISTFLFSFAMANDHTNNPVKTVDLIAEAPMDSDGIYSQSYPWAMALGSKNVWIGTGANVLCGGANPGRKVSFNTFMPSRDTSVMRCERKNPEWIPLGAPMNWRPPALWAIDRQTHQPKQIPVDTSTLLGFRSAGVIGNTVLMISEGVSGSADFGKLVVVMLDDQSGNLVRLIRLGPGGENGFSMPRNGVTFGDRYYFPYQNKADGMVMRVASVDAKGNFQSIGNFPGRGGVVTKYKDRLVFGAWGDKKTVVKIYVSSPQPFSVWKPFFSFDQYEPDEGAAMTYDTGAMTEHDGWLYFGTINGPLLAIPNEIKSMGPIPNPINVVGGERSVAVFRAKDIETDHPFIENLYGRKAYPAHVSPMPSSSPLRPGLWVVKKTGMQPKCGLAGFGNPNNRYIWSMASLNGHVYVGTMDMTTTILASAVNLVENTIKNTRVAGGDLYALDGDTGCDEPITKNGFGDPFVYGFRNLLASPEGLYIGGANPFNKTGGWHLYLMPTR